MAQIFPATISAGARLSVDIGAAVDIEPGAVVTVILRGASSVDLIANADGVAAATGAETSEWKPGRYAYVIRAERGGDVVEIERGGVTVDPDLALVEGGHDGRTHAQRVLDAVEATIEGRATSDQLAYSIKGRSFQFTPLNELLALRDRYRREVQRELTGRKVGRGGQIRVKM